VTGVVASGRAHRSVAVRCRPGLLNRSTTVVSNTAASFSMVLSVGFARLVLINPSPTGWSRAGEIGLAEFETVPEAFDVPAEHLGVRQPVLGKPVRERLVRFSYSGLEALAFALRLFVSSPHDGQTAPTPLLVRLS
jgi:hypothetical protein